VKACLEMGRVRFKVPSKNVILVEKFNISFSSTKNHTIITLPKHGGGDLFVHSLIGKAKKSFRRIG
jgi:hypothetical protein